MPRRRGHVHASVHSWKTQAVLRRFFAWFEECPEHPHTLRQSKGPMLAFVRAHSFPIRPPSVLTEEHPDKALNLGSPFDVVLYSDRSTRKAFPLNEVVAQHWQGDTA